MFGLDELLLQLGILPNTPRYDLARQVVGRWVTQEIHVFREIEDREPSLPELIQFAKFDHVNRPQPARH